MNPWFEQNNIAEKLRVAVETIANGRGWQVFEGLEKGELTVKLIHDGHSIRFEAVPHQPIIAPVDSPIIHTAKSEWKPKRREPEL